MKARHLFVDAADRTSFVDASGIRRWVGLSSGLLNIDMLALGRPMANELARVLSHYAKTGELLEIEKEEQPE